MFTWGDRYETAASIGFTTENAGLVPVAAGGRRGGDGGRTAARSGACSGGTRVYRRRLRRLYGSHSGKTGGARGGKQRLPARPAQPVSGGKLDGGRGAGGNAVAETAVQRGHRGTQTGGAGSPPGRVRGGVAQRLRIGGRAVPADANAGGGTAGSWRSPDAIGRDAGDAGRGSGLPARGVRGRNGRQSRRWKASTISL